MSSPFIHDYDLENLEKVTAKAFGFDLYTTPRFRPYFEAEAYEHMTSLLVRQSAKGVQTFVDVGAHYGFFDVLVGQTNPDCKVLAFEPIAENVAILQRNLHLNSVAADVHQAAVSNVTGREQFQVSEASDNSGFQANPAAGILRTIQTDVVRLDQFIDSILDGPVLVKIDTEGNEISVLEGMQAVIEERDDVRLMIEFNPRCLEANGATPTALLNLLDELGFDAYVVLDGEDQYAKLSAGMSWQPYLEGKTHRNLYCVKKTLSLNICVFSHSATLGGAEFSLLWLVDRMTSQYGSVFTVVFPGDGPLRDQVEALGAATMVVDYRWWCALASHTEPSVVDDLMCSDWQKVGAVVPSLSKLSPDVVLTITVVIPWGAVAAMMLDRPHIWWIHEYGRQGHGLNFYYGYEETLLTVEQSSNHVVVNSQAMAQTLFPALGPDKCSVATNHVGIRETVESEQPYFRHETALRLVITGTVTRPKGQDEAIQAIARLVDDGYDVELCVVGSLEGSPTFSRELHDFVEARSLADRIHFTGFLNSPHGVMGQAHVSLTCSKMEAFGNVTAEAMLLGRPVIGTNTGGTPELIQDGVNGFLYPPGDIGRLTEKIAFFADHPEEIRAFGERERKTISERLSVNPAESTCSSSARGTRTVATPTQSGSRAWRWNGNWVLKRAFKRVNARKDLALDALHLWSLSSAVDWPPVSPERLNSVINWPPVSPGRLTSVIDWPPVSPVRLTSSHSCRWLPSPPRGGLPRLCDTSPDY